MAEKDICVYTVPAVLEHKRSEECAEYYWEFHNLPKILTELGKRIMGTANDFKNVKDEDFPKLYFAVSGNIVGYFDIQDFGDYRVNFYPESFVELKTPIPQKPFQGFKYLEPIQ